MSNRNLCRPWLHPHVVGIYVDWLIPWTRGAFNFPFFWYPYLSPCRLQVDCCLLFNMFSCLLTNIASVRTKHHQSIVLWGRLHSLHLIRYVFLPCSSQKMSKDHWVSDWKKCHSTQFCFSKHNIGVTFCLVITEFHVIQCTRKLLAQLRVLTYTAEFNLWQLFDILQLLRY